MPRGGAPLSRSYRHPAVGRGEARTRAAVRDSREILDLDADGEQPQHDARSSLAIEGLHDADLAPEGALEHAHARSLFDAGLGARGGTPETPGAEHGSRMQRAREAGGGAEQ